MDSAAGANSQRQAGDQAVTTAEIAAAILEASRGRVAKHLSDGDFRDANLALKAATEHIAREYHGRVVLELIQNAHDALHKDRTDGRILVRLDPEDGDYGTFHVANSGLPFTESNFEAIRKVALSDKPPNEAIGNKGIGFKSVLEVTDSPTIRSTSTPGSCEFDGYCFKFPSIDDLYVLVDDPAAQQQIADEMLLLGLPIPTEPPSDAIARLAADGYVTVVSLPLRSQAAYDQIASQLDTLVEPDAPILLFLSRVGELLVEPADGTDTVFTRKVKQVRGLPRAQLVDLGPSGQFLVAQRSVPARILQSGLRDSIDQKLMDPKWGDWKGGVTVAAAVRTDGGDVDGRRYTHLPMAKEATSPARAHLNAPFYTNISRTEAKEDVPFNELLMDELCRCCIDTANSLRERRARWAPSAAIDLLAWGPNHSERWLAAAKAVGVSPKTTKLLPSLGAAGCGWSAFGEIRRWTDLRDDQRHIITGRSVAQVGATILCPKLGPDRLERIADLGYALDFDLDASDEEIGVWVEEIAKRLVMGPWRPRDWESFYDDLYELNLPLNALIGRQILVSDNGDLRAISLPPEGRRGRAKVMFFLPADDEEAALIDVPRSLCDDMAFMHREIDWNLRDGHVRKRPGREYLERINLVDEYRTKAVVRALRKIVDRSKARAVHHDAIRLAFQLFKTVSPEGQRDFDRLPVFVENRAGKLIKASSALFSPAWDTLSGQQLEELVVHASLQSSEVAGLKDRMLANPAPDQLPASEWHSFLVTLGVTDGLPFEPLTLSGGSVIGHAAADRQRLGRLVGLDEVESKQWDLDGPPVSFRSNTQYEFKEPPVVIAGQRDHAEFDGLTKTLFAQLVARRLDSASMTDLAVTLVKVSNPSHEPVTIPTPFHSFVAFAPWLPSRLPGQGEDTIFGAPTTTWHYEALSDRPLDRPPSFARLLSTDVGRELHSDTALIRLREVGLRIWNRPEYGSLLVAELTALVAAGVRSEHEGSIKAQLEAAWHQVITQELENPLKAAAGILVIRGGQIQVRSLDDEEGTLLIPCLGGASIDRLELPDVDLLPISPINGPAVADLLVDHIAARVVRTDELVLSVTVADVPINEDETVPLLDDERSWLPIFLLAAQRFPGSDYRRRGDTATREAFERLRATRVRLCEDAKIHFDFANTGIPIEPDRPRLVEYRTSLIVATGHSDKFDKAWTWRTLVDLRRQLAELLREPSLSWRLGTAMLQVREALRASADDVLETAVDDSVLANALEIGIAEIDQIRHVLKEGAVLDSLERLYPLVRVAFGSSVAIPFNPADTPVQDRGDLLGVLADLPSGTWDQAPSDILLLVENPVAWHELADQLGVSFSDLTRELFELGPPYRPDLNLEGQHSLFDAFIEEHREVITARLREAHLDSFRTVSDLSSYVVAHMIPIETDPAWVETCWLQDDAMMLERITVWLSDQGIDPDLKQPSELEPLLIVRKNNIELVSQIARVGAAAVRAWCIKNSETVPEPWDSDHPGTALVDEARAAGFLDFEQLTVTELIGWLAHLDRWPVKMPRTIEAEVLGLTAEDLRDRPEGRRPQDPPPTVTLGDRTINAEPYSYPDVVEHLDLTLSETFLKTPKRPIGLRNVEPGGSPPRRPPGEGGESKQPRDPEQLRAFVGFTGEVCALRWLQWQYRLDNDYCWVSEYGGLHRDDGSGDDSLGFDFCVERDGRPDLLFEVKASRGDSDEFELTRNEDAVARAHNGKGIYTILLVTNVLTDERQITPLPNPYSTDGRARYRLTGQSIRYRFWRT